MSKRKRNVSKDDLDPRLTKKPRGIESQEKLKKQNRDIGIRLFGGGNFVSLRDYFMKWLGDKFDDKFRVLLESPTRNFLNEVFVYVPPNFHENEEEVKSIQNVSNDISLKYLVNEITENNVKSLHKNEHILAMGCWVENKKHRGGRYNHQKVCVNESRNQILHNKAWTFLHKIIGDDFMKFLLESACCFKKIDGEGNSYLQLTGRMCQLGEIRTKNVNRSSRKLFRLEKKIVKPNPKKKLATTPATTKKKPPPVSTTVGKKKKPKKKKKKKKKIGVGNHPISRTSILYSISPWIENVFEKSHLLNGKGNTKEVFSHIFGVEYDKKAKKKTYFKAIIGIIEKIRQNQVRHGKKVRYLLQFYCPIKSDSDLENLHSGARQSQMTHNDEYNVQELIKMFSTHRQVFEFIRAVMRILIPMNFWGIPRNRDEFENNIKRFVELGRYEKFFVSDALSNIKVTKFGWIFVPGRKVANREYLSKLEKIRNLFEFIFQELIVKLIRAYFYVTESNRSRTNLYFYRFKVWNLIFDISKEKYTRVGNIFEKVESEEQLDELRRKSKFPNFPKLRFLPKEKTVRGIVNMGKKTITVNSTGKEYAQSINSILKNVLEIMKLENEKNPNKNLNCSIFGMNEFYHRILNFMKRVPKGFSTNGDRWPKLHCVKADVKSAYDNIQHKKLTEIIKRMFTNDVYEVRKFIVIDNQMGNVRSLYKRVADTSQREFEQIVSPRLKTLKSQVYIDRSVPIQIERSEVMDLIRNHIENNVIKIGREYFLQKKGIPQGSILSSILCSYVLADLEKEKLSDLPGVIQTEKNNIFGCLIRQIDDFLYISTLKDNCKTFLNRMYGGFSDYGVEIQSQKTKTTFDYNFEEDHCTLESSKYITYCGLKIVFGCESDPNRWQFFSSYENYHDCSLTEKLTIDYVHPNKTIADQLKRSLCFRLHPILLDHYLNTSRTIISNIYMSLLISAMKFHVLITRNGYIDRQNVVEKDCFRIISDVVGYVIRHINNQNRMIKEKLKSVYYPIKDIVVQYLGVGAFRRVLRRKQSKYTPVLKRLDSLLRNIEYKIQRAAGIDHEIVVDLVKKDQDNPMLQDLWKIKY